MTRAQTHADALKRARMTLRAGGILAFEKAEGANANSMHNQPGSQS